jgi:hypothetical protein
VKEEFPMRALRRATWSFALVGSLAVGAVLLAVPPAQAAVDPPGPSPAQYYGSSWGGVPIWPSSGFGYVWPSYSYTSPYAGSPGYPYYRYGSYYGSAYGLPYPVAPNFGAYYGDSNVGGGVPWPFYPSAGGVSFGDFFSPIGRCLYTGLAGIGGSSTDPQSYGYFAPFC